MKIKLATLLILLCIGLVNANQDEGSSRLKSLL
jgi:hypothetical protein